MSFSSDNIAAINVLITNHPLLVQLERKITADNKLIIDGAQAEMGKMQEQMREIMSKADVNYEETQKNLVQHAQDVAAAETKLSDMAAGMTGVVTVFNQETAAIREWIGQRQGEVQQQIADGRQNVDVLIAASSAEFAGIKTRINADMQQYLASSSSQQGQAAGGGGGGPRSILDPRDFKVEKLEKTPTLEVFKKWRHDLCLFLNSHPKWSNAGLYLDKARRWPKEIPFDEHDNIIDALGTDKFGQSVINKGDWIYQKHSPELYQLLCARVNLDLSTRFSQEGTTNGFEMWRMINREIDPAKKDADFFLKIKVQEQMSEPAPAAVARPGGVGQGYADISGFGGADVMTIE